MNLFKIFRRLYDEKFHWAFDSETDSTRIFNDLENFHDKALPESENKLQSIYAKVFKNNLFYLIAPILYLYLKYLLTKYTHEDYITRIIEKEMDE